jgi:hypothetical protein
MKKNNKYIIIVCVIAAITTLSIYFGVEKEEELKVEWLTSGPFSVQGYQHKLGEIIFIQARGIAPHEKGTIIVYTPKHVEYTSFPFDGSVKSDFNTYFRVDTTFRKDKCSPEDFVGVWTMAFVGVPYEHIKFEFVNEFIPGGEDDIINLCRDTT